MTPMKLLFTAATALWLAACQATATGVVTPTPSVAPSIAATGAPSAVPSGGAGGTPVAGPTTRPSSAPSAAPTPIPFKALGHFGEGTQGQPMPAGMDQRIKDQKALDALLDQIAEPKTGRPTVDFSTKEVLAFYGAGGSNGCFQLTLLALGHDTKLITPTLSSPPQAGDDRICTEAIVPPSYLLIEMDRSALPVAGIDAGKP